MVCKPSGWPTILLFSEYGRRVLTSRHLYSAFILILCPPPPQRPASWPNDVTFSKPSWLFYLTLPCFKSLHLLLQSFFFGFCLFSKFPGRMRSGSRDLLITLRQQEVQALTRGWHLRSTYCEVPIPKLQIPDTNLWQIKWFLNLEF